MPEYLHEKALVPCFLLTEICLPRSLETRELHTCTCLFGYQFYSGWNLWPVLLFPLCSMLRPEVESEEMGCRAFPRAGCGSCTLVTQMAMHTLWSQKGVKKNAQHKNCQSVQISLQGRDILEHNARSLSLCSLVETVFRIHWHLIMCLISLLFRAAILVLCGGCHRNGCLILI